MTNGILRSNKIVWAAIALAVILAAPVWSGGSSEADDAQEQAGPSGAAQGSDDRVSRTSNSNRPDDVPDEPPVPKNELPQQHVDQGAPGRAAGEFITNFARATVSYAEVLSGGPPKGGIPAIDRPQFVGTSQASEWVSEREPVLVVEASVAARAADRGLHRTQTDSDRSRESVEADEPDVVHIYPIQVLTWHEIVNDDVGGVPVTVTYCPLCNTGIAFYRGHYGATLSFNTTGRLRFSNLIMFDRETESWWQQASGEAIAGFFAGTKLQPVPVMMLSYGDARRQFPDARVLSRDTGYNRAYGTNPYVGYDSSERPFLLRGDNLGPGQRLDLMDRVVSIEHEESSASVAYPVLQEELVVERTIAGDRFYVLWEAGTASALDTRSIAEGEDVGTANAFFAETRRGEPVTLTAEDGAIVDEGTGSRWNASGVAISGPREGDRLEPAAGVQHFWFSHATLVAGEDDVSD